MNADELRKASIAAQERMEREALEVESKERMEYLDALYTVLSAGMQAAADRGEFSFEHELTYKKYVNVIVTHFQQLGFLVTVSDRWIERDETAFVLTFDWSGIEKG